MGKATAPYLAAHPGMSGIYPLEKGIDAFAARIGLIRAAQRSLDLQYYIFHLDNTGLVLLGELLSAADRGVRVRLLVDDIHTAGHDDTLAAIDAHPNVEVRLFNPFVHRGARWIDFVADFGRVNRRMHNKSITADNLETIVGGRNIGDEYYGVKSDLDFSDLDILSIGPVVPEVSAQFDRYWNSQLTYPVTSLLRDSAAGGAGLPRLRNLIAGRVQALRSTPYARRLEQNELAKGIVDGESPAFLWGDARVLADPPVKVALPPEDSSKHAATKLARTLERARRELILVSPYFVPGKQGVQWLCDIVRQGVRVKIVTNSYAATDVRVVHAGYAPYRDELLRAGIELYEMKPFAGTAGAYESRQLSVSGSSRSSLHAKTYMTDQRLVYVGSSNLDYRSARLNTEMGVVVESEALSAKLNQDFIRDILDVAYRVELVNDPQSGTERLVWVTWKNDREVLNDGEPGVGLFQRIIFGLLRILPIEEQL